MGRVGIGIFEKSDSAGSAFKVGDLVGRSVGVVRAYTLHKELTDAGVDAIAVGDDSKGMQMLMTGRIDAFFTFGPPGRYILSKMPDGRSIRYSEFRASPYFACFSKAFTVAEAARRMFNDGLSAIRADGVYDRILAKYR